MVWATHVGDGAAVSTKALSFGPTALRTRSRAVAGEVAEDASAEEIARPRKRENVEFASDSTPFRAIDAARTTSQAVGPAGKLMSIEDPSSAEDWFEVALERGADATSMLPARVESWGPFYMAGYAIECALKGYLMRFGMSFPRSGRDGHDLRGLWKSCGFRLGDLGDRTGAKTFFIDSWCTDFRYQPKILASSGQAFAPEALVQAAQQVAGWIRGLVRRGRRYR